MDPAEVREFLSGPPLAIEVHDRDRIPEKHKLKAALFGDDLQDEKISNVGTVTSVYKALNNYQPGSISLNLTVCTGRRTINNAFSGRDQPWDPHGVAKFDLSDLLLGQQYLHLKAPIHQCQIPDVLGTRESRQDGKMVGVSGALDGPGELTLSNETF